MRRYGGGAYVTAMHDMVMPLVLRSIVSFVTRPPWQVKRDRNHPAIVIWSFCNEVRAYPVPGTTEPTVHQPDQYECEQNDANYSGSRYRAAAYGVDGTRCVSCLAAHHARPEATH